jgi:hypothetical protein
MTQNQYGQSQGAGYGVRRDVVEDENDEYADDQGKPMTRFQRVASALRGDRPEPDEPDEDRVPADQAVTASPAATATEIGPGPDVAVDPAVAAGPGDRAGDYWDESQVPVTGEDQAVAVTNPDVPVIGPGTDPLAGPDEADAQTRPDIPGAELPVAQQPAAGAGATEAPGRTGRHAGVPAQDLRPGEATNTLDDLGELAYGNLLPDATDFTAQWQQIQFRFVDDPQGSVTEAAEVVSQVTAKLEAAIAERQRAIQERQQAILERQRSLHDRWGGGSEADTETLRETLRMYRAFLDQLIGPKV